MVDATTRGRWTYRALFLGVVAVVVFAKLLPLRPGPGGLPGPDVLVLIAFAWVLRRPDYVPAPLLAAVFLVADLLFMRPPGLWAACVVLGAEFLRSRSVSMREVSFFAEWLAVAAVYSAMVLANALVSAIFMVDQPALGLILIRLLFTVVTYPVVVILAAQALGLRKTLPGQVDELGRRL